MGEMEENRMWKERTVGWGMSKNQHKITAKILKNKLTEELQQRQKSSSQNLYEESTMYIPLFVYTNKYNRYVQLTIKQSIWQEFRYGA